MKVVVDLVNRKSFTDSFMIANKMCTIEKREMKTEISSLNNFALPRLHGVHCMQITYFLIRKHMGIILIFFFFFQ